MRVCTFNVHYWRDARGRGNTELVTGLLASLDCDVIGLNEVPREGDDLDQVARALGMNRHFGVESWLGNAILSRPPIGKADAFPITAGDEEGRCAVMAVISPGDYAVCSCHLEPYLEETRLRELRHLEDALTGGRTRPRPGPEALLVMGDFNSLRLSDYGPAFLEVVRARRRQAHHEEPRGEVVAAMDEWGYLDTFRLARAGSLEAYPDELARPIPEEEVSTCWVGTRVDYIWASPAFLRKHQVLRCFRVESDASDHLPVVLEFATA